MKAMQPPKLARWLLHNFGCSRNNEVLLGDLNQQLSTGRSGLWYWRQVIIAIVVGILKESWNNKLHTLAAIAMGWSALYVCYLALGPVSAFSEAQLWPDSSLMYYLFTRIAPGNWGFFYKAVHPALFVAMRLLMVFLAGEISGRVVRYPGRVNRKAMVLAYATSVLLASAVVFIDVQFTDITPNEGFAFAWPVLAVALVLLTSVLHGGGLFDSRAASA